MKPVRTLSGGATTEHFRAMAEQNAKVLTNVSLGTTLSNLDGDMNLGIYKGSGTTPGVANTEFAVTHTLDHIPFGFIVISKDKNAHFIKSTTAWTAATNTALGSIFLKCDIATVAFSIIIL